MLSDSVCSFVHLYTWTCVLRSDGVQSNNLIRIVLVREDWGAEEENTEFQVPFKYLNEHRGGWILAPVIVPFGDDKCFKVAFTASETLIGCEYSWSVKSG